MEGAYAPDAGIATRSPVSSRGIVMSRTRMSPDSQYLPASVTSSSGSAFIRFAITAS